MPKSLEGRPRSILSEDQVVENFNIEQLARLFERLGDLNVLRRRGGIATRMVVGDNDSGSIGEDSGLEDLAR